jgi:hypothetical protein
MTRYSMDAEGHEVPDLQGAWILYDDLTPLLDELRARVAARLAWPWPEIRDMLNGLGETTPG